MTDEDLRGALILQRGGLPRMGGERIRLLRAIGDQGSISGAARAVGLSYKAAWDAVAAMNNLFATPLVRAAPGGRAGGGATITPAGERVIATFAAVEDGLARVVNALEAGLGGPDTSLNPLWSLFMKTSTRNVYRCTVTKVTEGAVSAEVTMDLADGQTLTATITERSAEDLGLAPGTEVFALIKSSFVILAAGDAPGRMSVRNRLTGSVASRQDGAVNSEIVLDLGGGKTMAAIITLESARELNLQPGDRATALVKASHVILAMP
ncbi:TOBE domain-containing protein [Cereibacter sediminicola]|uniref:TOBE domain-containing protein n=1 Tax=Cereibacter sediminicola TaxID=2584941 RepID=UPI0011A737E2|nr:TOBE domain-containing protein [Cereibacter sediminicola]